MILFSSLQFKVDNVKIDKEKIEDFNTGWISINKNGIYEALTLPKKYKLNKQETITINNQIPNQWEGLTLAFRSSDQLINVYFNEKKTYSFGYHNNRAFGNTPGSSWHLIQIPENMTEGSVKIEFSSPYSNLIGSLPHIIVGTRSAVILYLIKNNLFSFFVCFIVFQLGIGLIFIYFIIKKTPLNIKSILYLGEFSIIMSLSTIIDTNMLQFFWGNQSALSVSIFLLNMIAPIILIYYLSETCFYYIKDRLHKISYVYIANFILAVTLQLLNISDFMEMNWLTNFLVLIGSIYLIIEMIKCLKNHKMNPSLFLSFIALLVFILSVILDIFDFYFIRSADTAIFQRLGLLFYIVILCILDFRKTLKLLRKGTEVEMLRHMAYEDILTKCKNRIYFDKKFKQLDKNISINSDIAIAIFDVNNLKKVNDQKGHREGDIMLIHAVGFMNEYFSEFTKICRIGGDEFAFIVSGIPESKLDQIFCQFKQDMKEKREKSELYFDIAYGYAYFNHALDKDLHSTFDRADRNMYICKDEMKKNAVIKKQS
jgi:diguanylate cyclase (GGDEF)-like protein